MEYNKAQLRSKILNKRRQLKSDELSTTAKAIADQVQSNILLRDRFISAHHILSYAAVNGEVPPEQLLRGLEATVYLPKIVDYGRCLMDFYSANQPLIENQYGIVEPKGEGSPKAVENIDVVLLPLVGFDQSGNRLGMGAGYYDRAFEPLLDQPQRPLLIGLAHPFQEVKSITPDSWDHPIDVILTGEKIIDPAGIIKPVKLKH